MSEEKLTEQEIASQLQRLEKAFRKHDSMLIGWLAGKIGDPDTARDIAQDAYLRVWRFAHRIEIENPQALLCSKPPPISLRMNSGRRSVFARAIRNNLPMTSTITYRICLLTRRLRNRRHAHEVMSRFLWRPLRTCRKRCAVRSS